MRSIRRLLPWIVTLIALSTSLGGCRRWMRRVHRARGTAAVVAVPALGPSDCPRATRTAAPRARLSADAPVRSVALAHDAIHAVVLALAGPHVSAAANATSHFATLEASGASEIETDPAIAGDAHGVLAAWRRIRGPERALVIATLRADGRTIESEQSVPIEGGAGDVAVALAGDVGAVAFVQPSGIAVQRTGRDGAPHGLPVLVPSSVGAEHLALATQDNRFLVAWARPDGDLGVMTLAEIPPDTGGVRPLSAFRTQSAHARPQIAASPSGILMLFVDGNADSTARDLYATAYAPTGVRTVETHALASDAADMTPALAWDGTDFGAAWQSAPTPTARGAAWFARIGPQANLVRAPMIVAGSAGLAATYGPAIAWANGFTLARADATPTAVALHRFGIGGCDPLP